METGPDLEMVEETPPLILDRNVRASGDGRCGGATWTDAPGEVPGHTDEMLSWFIMGYYGSQLLTNYLKNNNASRRIQNVFQIR